MSDAIDGLNIEFTGDSRGAEQGLDALSKALVNLQAATTKLGKALDGADFDRFGAGIRKLSTSLQPLAGFKSQAGNLVNSLKDFTKVAEEFNRFTNFDKFSSQITLLSKAIAPLSGVRTQLGATLKQLSSVPQIMRTLDEASPSMGAFTNQIAQLSSGLTPLGTVSSKLGTVLNQLTRFPQVLQQMQAASPNLSVFGTQITQLVAALTPLGTIQSKLGSVLGQLSRLPIIIQNLGTSLATQDVGGMITRLVKALAPLGQLTAKGNIISMLAKLPVVAGELAKVDMGAFTAQIQRLTEVLRPLATEMEKVARGFDAFPAKLQRVLKSNEAVTRSHTQLGVSFGRTALRAGVLVYAFNRIKRYAADAITKSNEYVENLHLFRLSMDTAAESAFKYGEAVQEAMGIDLSEWMRYQAVFQNMAKGFGIASEPAAILSKNLTQLGYDLASVFNVPFDVSMEKLESAVAGQPRPMREWGFDISETTLKMVALSHGIEKNVETMTQMEKAQLRFVQIMDTSRIQGYLGDMARTIMTPANAFRILNQQIIQLQRAFGDMIIPLLIQLVPYAIAVTKAFTALGRTVAELLGFELPVIDYSGVTQMRAAEEDVDGVTDSLKKLKSVTAGFDQLNIISDSAAKSVEALGGDLGLDLSKYDYDFMGGLTSNIENIMTTLEPVMKGIETTVTSIILWTREHLDGIKKAAIAIGVTMAGWSLSGPLLRGFYIIKSVLTGTSGLNANIGLTLMLSGATLLTGSSFSVAYNGANFKNLGSALLSAVAAVGGSLLLLGTGPAGWIVGLGIALVATIAGFTLGNNTKAKKQVKEAFYQGSDSYELDNMKVSLRDTQVSFQGGGLSFLDELTSSFGKKLQSIAFTAEGFTEGAQQIETLEKAISNTNLEIEKTKNLWDAGLISGENYTTQMIVLLDQFLQESASRFRAIRDNIYAALTGPLGAALEATGASLPAVMKIVSSVTEHATDQLTLTVNKLIELEKRKGSLTEAQNQELLDLYAKLTTDPFKEVTQGLQSQLAGLVLGDPVEAIREMGSMLVSAENELSNLLGTFISHVSALRDVAPPEDREQLDTFIKQTTQAGTLMRQDLGVIMNDALTEVFERMGVVGVNEAWKAYAKSFSNKGTQQMADQAALRSLEVTAHGLTSILKDMGKAAEEAGLNLKLPEASELKEYMKTLLDRAKAQRKSTERSGTDLGSTSIVPLDEYKLKPDRKLIPVNTEFIGKELIIGLRKGIGTFDPQAEAVAVAGAFTDEMKNQWGIASPSKVFILIGQQLIAGLEIGLSGVSTLVQKGKGLSKSVTKGFALGLSPMSKLLGDSAGVKSFDLINDTSLTGKGKTEGAAAEVKTFAEEIKRVIDEASNRVIPEGLKKIGGILERGADTSIGTISIIADKTMNSVYQTFAKGRMDVMASWEGTPAFFRDAIFAPILAHSGSLLSESLTRFKQTNGLVKMSWTDLVDWIKDNPLKEMGASVGEALVSMSDQFATSVSNMVMNVEWLRDAFVKSKNPIMNVLGEIIRELIRMYAQKAFLWVVSMLTTPGGAIGAAVLTAAGLWAASASKTKIEEYAGGGYPAQGSLFVAREAGPELVGRIGGRSSVVNNDQIVQSVSEGVYEAVVSAMSGQRSDDRPIELRVTLDGKEITRSVERIQSERGVDLLPGGLMYGY